jgi:metal-responsive CopG/Arc/MetJ family transcriptional regulator
MVRGRLSLPRDLVEEIELLVRKKGRSAFIAEAAEQELRRRRLLDADDEFARGR